LIDWITPVNFIQIGSLYRMENNFMFIIFLCLEFHWILKFMKLSHLFFCPSTQSHYYSAFLNVFKRAFRSNFNRYLFQAKRKSCETESWIFGKKVCNYTCQRDISLKLKRSEFLFLMMFCKAKSWSTASFSFGW